MRQHPIGTGPFKFVEFKPNEHIKIIRNPDYWKTGRPYLDAIEYTILRNRSTAMLAFSAGKFDITSPYDVTIPLLKDVKSQMPQAVCELAPTNVSRNLLVNHNMPPFDNSELRHAMALTLDRQAFITILTEGQGNIGGVMEPSPEGQWGLPPDLLQALPGYSHDVQKSRAEARRIMENLGYGANNRLKIKLSTRDIPPYRDPAVILIDQLKEIYIDAELEPVDTTQWFPKINRKDYTVALNLTGNGLDDPDQNFYENYVCGAEGNYNGYCNPEVDQLVEQQSREPDQDKRKSLVWAIEKRLAEDGARPIIFYSRGASCWRPELKDLTITVNSMYNGWRMEDVWFNK